MKVEKNDSVFFLRMPRAKREEAQELAHKLGINGAQLGRAALEIGLRAIKQKGLKLQVAEHGE